MELAKRKPNRLKNYDYSRSGAYFITICTKNRRNLLWEVGADIIRQPNPLLSGYGKVVDIAINEINFHYTNLIVDKYVIMPNHIHLIILITLRESGQIISAPTLSTVIGQMKRCVSKQIGFSIWQRSFHDHIIRNELDYQNIWQYIDTNPLSWEKDCFYTKD